MKILRITLNNIASLAGTHTVDFTRDPLRSAGLFSISGATGAGKSSLLDALCLALYDATPRLKQVGRLAELANGERQNDPRNLLRRGAGEGFAEVAFIGVDGKAWTSRWRVRRSRRSAEGALQNVEMALYEGHIPLGGEGVVTEGGKKTLVLQAIEDKIGLTFEQFTRAVLLAQNDFATFLKADDKERAEILQALTGTERFEAISKAVFARCAAEVKILETLNSALTGNAPLTEEARAEAEAARTQAEQKLADVETKQKALQSQADWFTARSKLVDQKSRAEESLQQALAQQKAAESRRSELARTEEIAREARQLRTAEQTAAALATAAIAAVEVAKTKRDELEVAYTAAVDQHQRAMEVHSQVLSEQKATEPLLRKARELDQGLSHVQTQFAKATSDLEAAGAALKTAEEKLKARIDERNVQLQRQQTLEQDRERLKAYAPFVADSSLWLHRIDAAIEGARHLIGERERTESLTTELTKLDQRTKTEEQSRAPRQAAFDAASAALNSTVVAESQFDTDELAATRIARESAKTVVAAFLNHLQNAQRLRERVQAEEGLLEQLQTDQGSDARALEQLESVEIPQAENAVEVAKTQLELIQAAVDDHAKRLRMTLHEGKECPVCGSTSHPYRQHAPELEAAAVKVAKRSVKDLEKKREDAISQRARLHGSMENRKTQIEAKVQELAATKTQLVELVFDSYDHAEVVAILSIDEDSRQSAMESRLLELNGELQSIERKEQAARNAAKVTSDCRDALQSAEAALKELDGRLRDLSAQRGIVSETQKNATSLLQKAELQSAEANDHLKDLWSRLPSAKQEFEADPAGFRVAFEKSVAECSDIEKRIAQVSSLIQQADAAIRPLEESKSAAQASVDECAARLKSISQDRDERVKERNELFEGRQADEVEEEMKNRLAASVLSLEAAANAKTDADKRLVAARSEWETKTQAGEQTQTQRLEAILVRERWMEAFTKRTGTPLSLDELDELLARDETWIQLERSTLGKLDQAVTAAESECRVYTEQLQQHLSTQPTQDEEAVVLAALQSVNDELNQAKSSLSAAQAVILSDDTRLSHNRELAEKIQQQETKADPWRKLNDLIGSKEGDKFRMIAQRRTLDVLLSYANHQLNQLAARYRLERISESLNLIVLDCDMGDERRSIHSLSGGESFLVSLALALGLASLTSNRLRIESLFIDEGFGSLDPETLNTAMSALMQLESQGRKVGVISHVTEMTDAIPVQIKVVKGRGGASRIVVPGAVLETALDASLVGAGAPQTASTSDQSAIDIAASLLAILQREAGRGKDKVSSKSLRDELGCDAAIFKAVVARLSAQVVADGRSLRLASAP
jgi:DNA repair protein SbcC/Rad50